MKILQSKLQPPKRPDTLHRHRLTRLFETIGQKKLFTVLAGAGFGKTTLVIDALSRRGFTHGWFRLDQQDMDFHVFISYLYSLVKLQSKTAGKDEGAMDMPGPGVKTQTHILLDWLVFLEAGIKDPFIIVLDDYHLVQESPEINQSLDFILQRLPAHIHLIIIGRKQLPLALSRLRVQDQLVEINEHELGFSGHEIHSYFQGDPGVTKAIIDEISKTTKGWAASLVLLKYTFNRNAQKGIPVTFQNIIKKPEYIFSYLKENIFDIQPKHVRHFMLKAALLPEIDVRVCEKAFRVNDARSVLSRMIEDHLLIFPVDDSGQVFYLHHLFKEFLLEQLHKTYPPSSIFDLHCRIAEITEGYDISQALYHYIEGRNYDKTIKLIKAHEMEFLLGGKIHFLGREIEKIPKKHIQRHPWLLLTLSRLHSHYGDPEKSMELISEALRLFRQRDAKEEMISCVIELGSQYYFSGHPKEGMLVMEQVVDDIDHPSQTYIIAMTFLTFLPSILGEFEKSKKFDQDAREVIADYPVSQKIVATALLDTSLSHTLYFKGEFESSQHLCKTLLKKVLKLNIEPCLPLVYYQLSTNSFYLGQYDAGCAYARKGIEACEKMSLEDSRKGWVYLSWAQNSLGLGNFNEAFNKIGKCTPLFEQPGNRWGFASTLDCLAAAYRAQNKTSMAKETLKKAMELIKGYGLDITRSILKNSFAAVLLDEKEFQEGLKVLLASRIGLEGASYHLFNNFLLASRAYFNLGRLSDALAQMDGAVDLALAHSYDHLLVKEKAWIVPLLRKTSDISIEIKPNTRSYLETVFGGELNRFPDVLKVRLLGKFTLGIGNKKMGSSNWKSAKALMLFKYLAAFRSRGYLHREKLLELLWPGQDPGKTAARFNMAMSALRKTLEPEIASKAPSTYIKRKKDTYRLFDDSRIEIDAERFSSLLAKAMKTGEESDRSLACYLNAIDLHRGEFLEEDPYEDWCIEMREAHSRDYESALKAVIHIFEQKKELPQAILYAEKLFAKNPLDETVVEKLMGFYAKTNCFSRAKDVYHKYAREARHHGLPVNGKLEPANPV